MATPGGGRQPLGPIPLGNRQLNLSPDDLLLITVNNYVPSIFVNYAGQLDTQGEAKAEIRIPNNPGLIGLRMHTAFVVLDPAAPLGSGRTAGRVEGAPRPVTRSPRRGAPVDHRPPTPPPFSRPLRGAPRLRVSPTPCPCRHPHRESFSNPIVSSRGPAFPLMGVSFRARMHSEGAGPDGAS